MVSRIINNNNGNTLLALFIQNKEILKFFSFFNNADVIKYPLKTKKYQWL